MQYQLLVDSLGLLSFLILFLLIFLMLLGVIRGTGRSRNLSLITFLMGLLVILGWLVVSMSRMGLISFSDWIDWGRYLDFGVRGLWLFLIDVYMVMWAFPDLLSQKKWILVIAFILPLIYEILMFIAFANSAFIELWLMFEIITVVLYMGIIPLYATFKYTRQERISGTPRVPWIWLTFLGLLIWFLGEFIIGIAMLFQLPGYNSYYSGIGALTVSGYTLGWIVMLVGFFLQRRTMKS